MTAGKRGLLFLLAVVLPALAASCVESRHPLSDENTSTIDQRLIGSWTDDGGGVWRVEKSKDVKNALNVTQPDPDGPNPLPIFTTTIKEKSYLSYKDSADPAEKKPKAVGYEIYQYVFADADTVQIRGMDAAVLLKAIAEKKLAGEIEVEKTTTRSILGLFGPEETVETETPVITDTTPNIVRYLQDHADECFPPKADR